MVLYGNAVEKLPFAAMHVLNLNKEFTYSSGFEELLEKIETKYHRELNESLLTLKCPFCGTISSSKILENGHNIRKCQCGKIFYWDSGIIESHIKQNTHSAPNNTENNKNVSDNKFTRWIKSLVSR